MKPYHFVAFLSCLLLMILTSCSSQESSDAPSLAKCLNIGNALEAPKNQAWDVPMDVSYFSIIKEAGFETVRLPIRFSDYTAAASENYLLDENFMQQIDSYLQAASEQHLTVILDFHHFVEMMDNPEENRVKFISIWQQLSTRYKDYPATLVFELLNEPQKNLTSDTWNSLIADTVSAIRAIDQKHYLIIGGVNYNSIDSLFGLQLPKDKRIIATFHYYEPNDVTFQGNEFHPGYENLHDIAWEATPAQLSYLQNRLQMAKNWATNNNVKLFLGEFGITKTAPDSTRLTWTANVANEAAKLGIDYAYWEFASGFGIYDLNTKQWNTDMLNALIPPVDSH